MIKKQFKIVKEKIVEQAHNVLGIERRSTSRKAYRDYLENIFKIQTVSQDRELVLTIVTLTHRLLYEYSKENGQTETMNMIKEANH